MTAAKGLGGYSSDVLDEVERVRRVVCDLHAELPRWDLVVWTAGNVSQRLQIGRASCRERV